MLAYFDITININFFSGIMFFAFMLGCFFSWSIVAYLLHKYLTFSTVLYEKSTPGFKQVREFCSVLYRSKVLYEMLIKILE